MISENIKHPTDSSFDEEVLQSSLVTLVFFWATWSGPCKQSTPIMHSLAVQYLGRLQVCFVNVDQQLTLAQRFAVGPVPHLIIFKGGKIVASIVGAIPRTKIESELLKHLQ